MEINSKLNEINLMITYTYKTRRNKYKIIDSSLSVLQDEIFVLVMTSDDTTRRHQACHLGQALATSDLVRFFGKSENNVH